MRKLVTWLLVTLGIAALVRKLRRQEEAVEPAPTAPSTEDPADELRRKLAETRSDEPEAAASATAEPSVEERRADVHEQGRAALDEMQPADEE